MEIAEDSWFYLDFKENIYFFVKYVSAMAEEVKRLSEEERERINKQMDIIVARQEKESEERWAKMTPNEKQAAEKYARHMHRKWAAESGGVV